MMSTNQSKLLIIIFSVIALFTLYSPQTLAQSEVVETPLQETILSYAPFAAAWSPDGQIIAVTEINGTHLYDTQLQEIAFYAGDAIAGISWSPDSSSFATAGGFYANEGTIQIFEQDTDTEAFELQNTIVTPHKDAVQVVWSPDGTMLATVSRDTEDDSDAIIYTTEIWYINGTLKTTLQHQYLSGFSNLSWSLDSRMIAGGGTEYICNGEFCYCNDEICNEGMFIADVDSGERLYFVGSETPHSISWSIQNEIAVDWPEFAVYNPDTGIQIRVLGPSSGNVKWHPSGNWIVSELGDYIDIRDRLGNFIFSFHFSFPIAADRWRSIDWYYDGTKLLAISENGHIQIWDTSSLEMN